MPSNPVELFPRPEEVAVAHVPAGAKVLVHRDGYGKDGEYPADQFPMSMDADLWVTVPGDRLLTGWGAAICAYYSPAGIRNGRHRRDRDIWLQAAALTERGGTAYVVLEKQWPYGQPVWAAVSVRTGQHDPELTEGAESR
jgi:hypothetical protein